MEYSAGDLQPGTLVHDGPRTRVYRSRLPDGRAVVLKVLKSTADDAVNRARLERELTLAQRVQSPWVVAAYGFATCEGRLALVLEDFSGEPLNRAITSAAPLATRVAIASQIARALAVVHRHGIVHRDVKPSNVIHRPSTGETKITDFGIALTLGDAADVGSTLEGTLAYMAPEQARRIGRGVDHRADLYAFGVLLFELFTGERPFQAGDALEWMHCHAALAPRSPSEIAAVPEPLAAVVLKLLAKAPEDRYQSAEGVEHDLRRCFDDLSNARPVAAFTPGERDVVSELRFPEHVHGRHRESSALNEAFARVVSRNNNEVVLVTGDAGIGKSSVVGQLRGVVARQRGFFVSGKFDQYRVHVPYSAIGQAAAELVGQLLTFGDERLGAIKGALLESLDGNGAVLIDLFPSLERLLGPQPPVPELPAVATQNRLHSAMRAFLRAVDAPLVLFLDDLQWADGASIDLLRAVLVHAAQGSTLAVFAYRDGEVRAGHPFHGLLGELNAGEVALSTLPVGPLDAAAVAEMIGATLNAPAALVADVTSVVTAKTAGNPFFVRELLRALHAKGFMRYVSAERRWVVDVRAAEAVNVSDNVVELVVARLDQLPSDARDALRTAAFLGSEFDLHDLAAVLAREDAHVEAMLRPAVDGGLLSLSRGDDAPLRARFAHDRIQQAAYALTSAESTASMHLAVGRVLARALDSDRRSTKIFEVADHLDAAFDLITEPSERDRLLHVFLAAAERARSATAYRPARAYLARATQLLGEEAWMSRFDLAFEAHIDLAECDYLAGNLEAARTVFDELLGRARDDLERGRIYYLQIHLLQVAGDLATATSLSLRAFAIFGANAPETDEAAARAVEEDHRVVRALLGDRPVAEHVDDPPMTDPRTLMLVALLEASGPPIYMVRPALFPWIALQLVKQTLRFGNAKASCYGYGIYALLRAAVQGDVEGGYALSLLAIELNAKLEDVKLEGCMLHLLGDHVNFWKNPIATDLPILERGFAACVRGGDHIYSNYIGFQAPWHAYESGALLRDVAAMVDKYAAFAVETGHAPVHVTLRAERQFIRALQGATAANLTGEDFDAEQAVEVSSRAGFGCGVVYIHILQLVASYTFGDMEAALRASERAAPELGAAFSMPMYVTYVFYRALVLAKQPKTDSAIDELRGHHASLVTWARACPANFADKAALVGAELARLAGDIPAALTLYEEARLAARAQGFVQYEALACELAAELYASLRIASVERTLLADAAALYQRWGAGGKVSALVASHRGLETARIGRSDDTSSSSSTTTSGAIELMSSVKAAQSLSAEIRLPRLLARLMAIVIEHAGAQRGSLVLVEDGALVIAAHALLDRRSGLQPAPESAASVPKSLVDYVRRTMEPVIIDDATAAHRFASDPYFQSSRQRSVLCKPIVRQGRLSGMFYLENALVTGAFGPSRLQTLEVLASQTAISIENSRLYEASQAAVRARDEFLSIASHELKTPLTPLTMQIHRLTSAIKKGTLQQTSDDVLLRIAAGCDAQITRLTRLIGMLLDVSRIGSEKLSLERATVDLDALVLEVVELHAQTANAQKCSVSVLGGGGVAGNWDRARLHQVVTNLFLNALKFGRGRPVTISVKRLGDSAELTVTDHGVGVEVTDRQRIFNRFERIRSADNVDGLGLGLFIVRALVEAHRGQIAVESTDGGGATFRVTLPLF